MHFVTTQSSVLRLFQLQPENRNQGEHGNGVGALPCMWLLHVLLPLNYGQLKGVFSILH